MFRSAKDKSKHFKYSEVDNLTRQVFKDDIVCSVSAPKELMKPKGFYAIKEYNKVGKLILQANQEH